MRKEEKTKKGEITVQHLVIIIILIVGFGIILFFIYNLKFTETLDEKTCHTSVILRGAISAGTAAFGKDFVPLNCKTKKICITAGLIGGNCKDIFGNVKGIKKVKVKNTDQIKMAIARETVSCWEMIGEGKVDLFSQASAKRYGLGDVYSSCIICSRIALDYEGLKKAGITQQDIENIDITAYMQTYKMPGKNMSYFDYISGGHSIFKEEDLLFAGDREKGAGDILKTDNGLGDAKELEDIKIVPVQDKEVGEEIAIMFMQITAPDHKDVIKNTIGDLGKFWLGSFFVAPVTTMKFTIKSIGAAKFTLPLLAILGLTQQGLVAWNRGVAAGYCGDVSVGKEARSGCSAVRMVNYDAQGISMYCRAIESIP